jgi:phage terminase small subunit
MDSDRRIVVTMKQDFAAQVKAQTEVWQGQIKDYQEQIEAAGAKGRAEYEKAVAKMRMKTDEARQLFDQVQKVNETAWKDMQGATQRAFAELQKGWADALSRFK